MNKLANQFSFILDWALTRQTLSISQAFLDTMVSDSQQANVNKATAFQGETWVLG